MKTRMKAIKSKEQPGRWTVGFKRSNMRNFSGLEHIDGVFDTKAEAVEKIKSTLDDWSGYAIAENLFIIHEEKN